MALTSTTPDSVEQQHELPPKPGRRQRGFAMRCYAVAFIAQWLLWGLPVDRFLIFVWLLAAAVCWNIVQPWRYHLGWARDWSPILGLLLVYDYSRGFAENGRAPHITEMIVADRAMFGGQLPTIWLQQHFFDPSQVHWWDVVGAFVYMSHFVVSLGLGIALWLYRRQLWAAFMRRWFCLTALGLATYFLYPAAPPWWAAEMGYINETVARGSTRGWSAIGLDGTGRLLRDGQLLANPVAAVPSLHAAFAALVAVFLATLLAKKWWPLLLAYPVVMGLTLMYSGEHYAIDVLVGWAYVGVSWFGVSLGERWWRARRARAAMTAVPVSPVSPALSPGSPTEPHEKMRQRELVQ